MPSYDYECKSCKHRFEVFQSMADAPLTKCPECGKSIRRLIGGGLGVIFKGSGFYVTDSRNSTSASSLSSSTNSAKNGDTKETKEKSPAPSEPSSKEKAAV